MVAETDVLVVGAGPTGLTLAIELQRRGIRHRAIEATAGGRNGSRGKGLQPRTQEVFELLGVLDAVTERSGPYPQFEVHVGPVGIPLGRLSKETQPSLGIPYPNLRMIPQFETEAILKTRLEALGGRVELGTSLTGYTQAADRVEAELSTGERICARYLVGADGGKSVVRKVLGLKLEGESLKSQPFLTADVRVDGLDRTHWHGYPFAGGGLLSLCPLPGTDLFQLVAISKTELGPDDLTFEAIAARVKRASRRLTLTDVTWSSIYRPQVRMVSRFQEGRVFLAGDAAHVHPAAGGQGLNTGVQDAFNLGWKLAAVIRGASERLLDSYTAERLPIAADVLGLSKTLQLKPSLRRGDREKQLAITYRGGPLAQDVTATSTGLRAGDRAPDARLGDGARLFDLLRVGAFVSLERDGIQPSPTVAPIHRHRLVPGPELDALYGTPDQLLIRPDGYLAAVDARGARRFIEAFWPRTIPSDP